MISSVGLCLSSLSFSTQSSSQHPLGICKHTRLQCPNFTSFVQLHYDFFFNSSCINLSFECCHTIARSLFSESAHQQLSIYPHSGKSDQSITFAPHCIHGSAVISMHTTCVHNKADPNRAEAPSFPVPLIYTSVAEVLKAKASQLAPSAPAQIRAHSWTLLAFYISIYNPDSFKGTATYGFSVPLCCFGTVELRGLQLGIPKELCITASQHSVN